MTDVLSAEARRRCMSSNKSRDTSIELRVRHQLWSMGYRYRLGYPLLGRPDLTFPKERVAVFIDGCFWHGCPRHISRPKTNVSYWQKKIAQNRGRDKLVSSQLREMGWTVVRVWEHQITKSPMRVASQIAQKLDRIRSGLELRKGFHS